MKEKQNAIYFWVTTYIMLFVYAVVLSGFTLIQYNRIKKFKKDKIELENEIECQQQNECELIFQKEQIVFLEKSLSQCVSLYDNKFNKR